MNEWVERSIEIANSPGYLDQLHQIYPIRVGPKRTIPTQVKEQLRSVYDRQDELSLLQALLPLHKFPVADPYVAFLRKRDFFPEYSPQTVRRIARRVLSMTFEEIIDAMEEPKAISRQMGPLFSDWLETLEYSLLSGPELQHYGGAIAFLKGSNGQRKDYANRVLGCNLDKGPDLLAKVGTQHVIGEAKFLTDYGGAQDRQFDDALALLRGKKGDAIRIAVLDGVVWIEDSTRMFRTVCELDKPAFTGLLLGDFLESLLG